MYRVNSNPLLISATKQMHLVEEVRKKKKEVKVGDETPEWQSVSSIFHSWISINSKKSRLIKPCHCHEILWIIFSFRDLSVHGPLEIINSLFLIKRLIKGDLHSALNWLCIRSFFLISTSLQPDVVNLKYFKLWILLDGRE